MNVSVVIASYRTPSLTEASARSALASGARTVIVIDNASDDETLSRLAGIGDPRLRVLSNEVNLGFGAACNRGAREASADILLFLNSDAELNRLAASDMIAEVRRWEGRAIIGPRLVSESGKIQPSVLLPTPWEWTMRALGLNLIGRWGRKNAVLRSLLKRNRMAVEHGSARSATGPMDMKMVQGSCFVIGSEAFTELGGFDERFFMYFEDADLCRRAITAGMPVRYLPGAVVKHIGGASSGDWRFGNQHARSMRRYFEKWWGRPGGAVVPLLFWLRFVASAITFRPRTRRAFEAFRAATDSSPDRPMVAFAIESERHARPVTPGAPARTR